MDTLSEGVDYITFDLPPGPAIIPQYIYVNIHKGGLLFVFFAMMVYYENFSFAAWLYLALHGSYGMLWLLKDITFPDKSFRRKVTIASFLYPWPIALIPLHYAGYYVISGEAP